METANDTGSRGTVVLYEDSPTARSRWNEFLHTTPHANFYQRFEWKDVNEREFGHGSRYLAYEHAGRLQGVLPIVLIESRLFGRILCSMPFLNFGGPAAESSEAEAALIRHGCDLATEGRADYLEIRSTREIPGLSTSAHKVSMTLALNPDPDVLWEAFKSKHRTNVRRVYKDDITVRSGHDELLDVFYELMAESWRALGTPIFRKSFFKTILDTFGADIRIFVAYRGTTPVATTLNGHFRDTVEGMWAGGTSEGRRLQVNYVLYWEMIKDACERGYKSFHLGRSTIDTGGESFKKKWNADATQLYWQYFLPGGGTPPQLNVDNPKFSLAIKAWRRLPLWLTKRVGPLVSRSIP